MLFKKLKFLFLAAPIQYSIGTVAYVMAQTPMSSLQAASRILAHHSLRQSSKEALHYRTMNDNDDNSHNNGSDNENDDQSVLSDWLIVIIACTVCFVLIALLCTALYCCCGFKCCSSTRDASKTIRSSNAECNKVCNNETGVDLESLKLPTAPSIVSLEEEKIDYSYVVSTVVRALDGVDSNEEHSSVPPPTVTDHLCNEDLWLSNRFIKGMSEAYFFLGSDREKDPSAPPVTLDSPIDCRNEQQPQSTFRWSTVSSATAASAVLNTEGVIIIDAEDVRRLSQSRASTVAVVHIPEV